MSSDHDHHIGAAKHERPLRWALVLTATFLAAEVVGGIITNSLSLLSDAAHMATDVFALAISLVAVRLSRKPPDAKRTFGYARMEAIGALVNCLLLFVAAGYILLEAVGRFRKPAEVASTGMLVIAAGGLLVNLVGMMLLKSSSGDSLSVKGAYLEVWSDMLGSVGVMLGAVVIKVTNWTVVDPIIAVLISLWVLPRTVTLLRKAGQILMEGVPSHISVDKVRSTLLSHDGVLSVHDLHIWALGSRQPALTAHVVVADATDATSLRESMATTLDSTFGIAHTTLQFERGIDSDNCQACDLDRLR